MISFGEIALVAALFIKDGGKHMTNYTSIWMERHSRGQVVGKGSPRVRCKKYYHMSSNLMKFRSETGKPEVHQLRSIIYDS